MGRAGSAGRLGGETGAKLSDPRFISGLLFRTHWKGTQGLPVDTCSGAHHSSLLRSTSCTADRDWATSGFPPHSAHMAVGPSHTQAAPM